MNAKEFWRNVQPLSITKNPPDKTLKDKETLSLSCAVDVGRSTFVEYQWYRNGKALSGEISSSLSRQVNMGDNGASWQCHITNDVGTVKTRSAKSTVKPLNITTITGNPSYKSWWDPEPWVDIKYHESSFTVNTPLGRMTVYVWRFDDTLGPQRYEARLTCNDQFHKYNKVRMAIHGGTTLTIGKSGSRYGVKKHYSRNSQSGSLGAFVREIYSAGKAGRTVTMTVKFHN